MRQNSGRKRIINFRAFLVVALFLLCAVFSALVATVFAWAGAVFFVLILAAAAAFALYHRKNAEKRLTFIICLFCCAVAFCSFLTVNAVWIKKGVDYSKALSVVGTVECDVTVDGQRKIYLKDVSFNGENASGIVLLYVKTGAVKPEDDGETNGGTESEMNGGVASAFVSGTIVSLTCRVTPLRLVDGLTASGSAFRENRRYTAAVTDTEITKIGSRDPGLFIKIREFIHGKLTKGLGEEYGALSYGMVTGDKAYISLVTRNYFSAAGLVHILTVSGLHLGFLTAILTLILKKARAARWATAAITLGVLFFYAFIAGFSPSVMRATLMSAVGVWVYLFGRRSDTLNTLSFAFCLIVTFMPFYLFEAGFILSVCCVYGIALFYKPFFSGLRKIRIGRIKIPKPLARAVAISASIQIGFIPAVIYIFDNVQAYGFIVNVVFLPVISASFMLMIVCLIFTCIVPPASFVFKPVLWGLKALDFVAFNVSRLPYARIVVYSLPVIFVIYAFYFLCSRYFMVRRRWIIWLTTLALGISLIVVQNPAAVGKSNITPLSNGYSALTYITEGDSGYLAGDVWSGYLTLDRLKELRVRRLDAVFVNSMDSGIAYQIQVISGVFSGFTLYYPDFFGSYTGLSEGEAKERQKKDNEERRAIEAQLKNIKTVPFKCGGDGDGGETEDTAEIIPLCGGFSAVFWGGEFAAYEFCPVAGGGGRANVLLPKTNFKKKWYDAPQTADRYDIVCAYSYRPLGERPEEKLYLISADAEGNNVYSAGRRFLSYNYLTFKFI